MINTDKYEGHQYERMQIDTWHHPDTPEEVIIANANLMHEAPLLLEEVKRLRGLLQEVADDYTDAEGITYEIYCEFGGEEE